MPDSDKPTMSVHNSDKIQIDTNGNKFRGPFNPNGPTDVAQINNYYYYYYKTREEFSVKCKRGRADTGQIRLEEEYLGEGSCNEVMDSFARDFLYGSENV